MENEKKKNENNVKHDNYCEQKRTWINKEKLQEGNSTFIRAENWQHIITRNNRNNKRIKEKKEKEKNRLILQRTKATIH